MCFDDDDEEEDDDDATPNKEDILVSTIFLKNVFISLEKARMFFANQLSFFSFLQRQPQEDSNN